MNSSPESMRLFFALWPDDAARSRLMQLQGALQGRIVPYSNLHLTLAFLGQQPSGVVDAGKDILLRLPAEPAAITLDRLGYFARNRVAWAGMHQVPGALTALHEQLGRELNRHGINCKEQQSFKPHLTLARDASPPGDITFEPIRWRASEVVLVRSTTLPSGSVYEVLASRSLDERIWIPDENAGGEEMS